MGTKPRSHLSSELPCLVFYSRLCRLGLWQLVESVRRQLVLSFQLVINQSINQSIKFLLQATRPINTHCTHNKKDTHTHAHKLQTTTKFQCESGAIPRRATPCRIRSERTFRLRVFPLVVVVRGSVECDDRSKRRPSVRVLIGYGGCRCRLTRLIDATSTTTMFDDFLLVPFDSIPLARRAAARPSTTTLWRSWPADL